MKVIIYCCLLSLGLLSFGLIGDAEDGIYSEYLRSKREWVLKILFIAILGMVVILNYDFIKELVIFIFGE